MKLNLTYRMLSILLAATLLGSCQIGKRYTRPELNLPDTLDSLSVDTMSIGDYPWEEVYTDTTLQALIRKTLAYNKDMQIAAARVKELAARKRIQIGNMLPQVGLRIYAERERENYGGDSYSQGEAVISSGGKEPSLYIGLKSDTKILNITTENITPITEEQTREKPQLIIVDDL